MSRLMELYKKSNSGHKILSADDFKEYAQLRKEEFQERRLELLAKGCENVKACKDGAGDIIGWTYENREPVL